ncbi:MAG: carboxypeptidase-like regulatory domain-containing protein, partial [Planctomycetota bacterium]
RKVKGAGANAGTTRTDASGRFRVVFPVATAPDLIGKLVLTPSCSGWNGKSEVRVKLDASLRPGINDLGDLIVHRTQSALARGRVVDDSGAPVSKALVDVFAAEIVDGVETWRYCQSVGGNSGEDGSFTIEGHVPGDRFMLRASRRGHADGQSAVFASNAEAVWIVLTRSAQIKGTAWLDAALISEKVWVRATRKSDSQEQRELFRDRERACIDRFGNFQLEDVRPGECDLEFVLDRERKPSFVLEGIQLRAGEAATDARLGSIDLRGKIVRSSPTEVPKRD